MSSVCWFAVFMAGFSACRGFAQRLRPVDEGIKEDIRQVRLFGIMRCAGMRQSARRPAGNLGVRNGLNFKSWWGVRGLKKL